MNVDGLLLVRILADFGLSVLIWLVQLVIYPSFVHFRRADLTRWHSKYTRAISLVVMPLMLTQLIVVGIQLLGETHGYVIVSVVLVALAWALTFLIFVPMHNKIAQENFDDELLRRLVGKNWWRTLVWTLLFLLDVLVVF